ncbi:uncharacterized protein ACN427_000490 [Glossina fuscipes fuscipes]
MGSLERTFSNCVRRVTLKQLNWIIFLASFVLFRLTHDWPKTFCVVSILLFFVIVVYCVLNCGRKYMFTSKIVFLIIIAFMLVCAWGRGFLLSDTLSHVFKIVFENKEEAFASELIDYLQRKYSCCGWNGPEDYLKGHIPESCISRNFDHGVYAAGCKSKFHL